jgi:hypothetical protein
MCDGRTAGFWIFCFEVSGWFLCAATSANTGSFDFAKAWAHPQTTPRAPHADLSGSIGVIRFEFTWLEFT